MGFQLQLWEASWCSELCWWNLSLSNNCPNMCPHHRFTLLLQLSLPLWPPLCSRLRPPLAPADGGRPCRGLPHMAAKLYISMTVRTKCELQAWLKMQLHIHFYVLFSIQHPSYDYLFTDAVVYTLSLRYVKPSSCFGQRLFCLILIFENIWNSTWRHALLYTEVWQLSFTFLILLSSADWLASEVCWFIWL